MNNMILQVPMSRQLKLEAEKEAKAQGFSSLQEFLRLIMTKMSNKTLNVSVEDKIRVKDLPAVRLSPQAEKRYAKIDEEIRKGKNVYYAKDTDDLMRQLHGDTIPSKLS